MAGLDTEAGRLNVNAWLDKPFTIHSLGRTVREGLDEALAESVAQSSCLQPRLPV